MKIAFISDIHSNIFALKSVIAHIKKLNINKICILGDIIDYYYYPDEVLAALLDDDLDIISIIKGNHEDNLKFLFNNKDQLDDYTNKYGHGMEKVFNKCTKIQIEYLINLKEKDELNINNLKIGLFHGSIESNKEHIYPDAPFDVLKKHWLHIIKFPFHVFVTDIDLISMNFKILYKDLHEFPVPVSCKSVSKCHIF